MQINNNREMHILSEHLWKLRRDLQQVEDQYEAAVKGFKLCSESFGKQWGYRCPVECGHCQGTGWVKRTEG